jgi:hypothetical protein
MGAHRAPKIVFRLTELPSVPLPARRYNSRHKVTFDVASEPATGYVCQWVKYSGRYEHMSPK